MDAVQQLRWSLQALAQPARVQIALFPPFVVVADELALDFDNWYWAALPCWNVSVHPLLALSELDRALDAMSGLDCWTNDALRERPEWVRVRELARTALGALGWTADPPPTGRSVYVQGRPAD